MPAVRLLGLTKDFPAGFWRVRSHRALDDISLDVQPGEVLGYLGPNGSGKTTTFKLLMQFIFPTAGTAEILGRPLTDRDVRRRIGFLPQSPSFGAHHTPEEPLHFAARLGGMAAPDANRRTRVALDRVAIGAERRWRVSRLSKGIVQRVAIALSLVHDPEVVLLDEPLAGLDPVGRHQIRDLILTLRGEGRTLMLSSHILAHAEVLCDRQTLGSRRVTASVESPLRPLPARVPVSPGGAAP